jgi:hypothetical protein
MCDDINKLINKQKLMIAIAMIAVLATIGSMSSIGNMNKNAFAAVIVRTSDSSSNTDDQQSSSSDNGDNGGDSGGSSGSSGSSDSGGGSSGSSDSGLSHKQKLHNQLDSIGLCPPEHECSCTPASGVFHDHTTGFNINTGCTSDKG